MYVVCMVLPYKSRKVSGSEDAVSFFTLQSELKTNAKLIYPTTIVHIRGLKLHIAFEISSVVLAPDQFKILRNKKTPCRSWQVVYIKLMTALDVNVLR